MESLPFLPSSHHLTNCTRPATSSTPSLNPPASNPIGRFIVLCRLCACCVPGGHKPWCRGSSSCLALEGWPLPADAMMTQHPWAFPSGLGSSRYGPAACTPAAEACGERYCAGGQQAASRWPTRTSSASSKRGTTDGPRDKEDRAADETPLLRSSGPG